MTIAFPHKAGAGGPGSFQKRFQEKAIEHGWKMIYSDSKVTPDVVFIVGGTKKIVWLLKMKLKKVPILLRLDGIYWLHKKKKVGIKNYITAELMNFTIKCIHAFMADNVIYQSKFVKQWWDKKGWKKHKNSAIIYNGVDTSMILSDFSSEKKINRLVVLEGVIDYTPYALRMLNDLANRLPQTLKIEVYGKFENKNLLAQLDKRLIYKGFIERNQVFNVLKNSIYLSLDINPACPNTVIEALSSGAPVVGFNTGALQELVIEDSGIVVPYGSNPWDLDYPDISKLEKAIVDVLENYHYYSTNALKVAKTYFGIHTMFTAYKAEILNAIR